MKALVRHGVSCNGAADGRAGQRHGEPIPPAPIAPRAVKPGALHRAGRARPAPRTEGRHLALRPAALRTRDGSGGSAGDMLRLCRVISHICRFLALARLTLAEPDGLVR